MIFNFEYINFERVTIIYMWTYMLKTILTRTYIFSVKIIENK
jgi:hypothetical protein